MRHAPWVRPPGPALPSAATPATAARRAGLLLILLLATGTGCAEDSYDRPGTWRATGVNDQNLALMVADPAHLRQGVAAPNDRAVAGTLPVVRLETGRRPRLPATTVVGVGTAVTDAPIGGAGVGAGAGAR